MFLNGMDKLSVITLPVGDMPGRFTVSGDKAARAGSARVSLCVAHHVGHRGASRRHIFHASMRFDFGHTEMFGTSKRHESSDDFPQVTVRPQRPWLLTQIDMPVHPLMKHVMDTLRVSSDVHRHGSSEGQQNADELRTRGTQAPARGAGPNRQPIALVGVIAIVAFNGTQRFLVLGSPGPPHARTGHGQHAARGPGQRAVGVAVWLLRGLPGLKGQGPQIRRELRERKPSAHSVKRLMHVARAPSKRVRSPFDKGIDLVARFGNAKQVAALTDKSASPQNVS